MYVGRFTPYVFDFGREASEKTKDKAVLYNDSVTWMVLGNMDKKRMLNKTVLINKGVGDKSSDKIKKGSRKEQ